MGNTESTPRTQMTLNEFLKENKKDPVAHTASKMAEEMTKAAVTVTKDMAALAVRAGAEAAVGAAVGAEAAAVAGPIGMVAGAVATAILGGIWDAMIPPTKVYPAIADIREALGQKLQEDTITKINGLLGDLEAKLKFDYAIDRKNSDLTDSSSRQRLYDQLKEINDKMDGIIGTLMREEYAKIGLVSFLLLAGLRLAVYQEMANVDPLNKDPDFHPAKSPRYALPYSGLVAAHARMYADHAEKLWLQVLEDRKQTIKITKEQSGGRIDDKLTGYFMKDGNRSVDLLVDEYWGMQQKKLVERFCYPEDIIANWRRLIVVPINIPIQPDVNTPLDGPGSSSFLPDLVRGFVPRRSRRIKK